jgi:hypothetical protein
MEPSRARGVQPTDADRALLAFAAEHRFVLCAQVALLLAVSDATAGARLRRLGRAGYLRRVRELHRGPAWHQITASGLRAVGSELPAPRGFDLATHRHDAGLAWLMLAARAGRFGDARRVVSEREMRSGDGRAPAMAPRYGVRLGGVGPGGRDRLHYPDMAIVTSTGHRVAFELELSTKEPERRERILSAYAADHRIDAVVYLVDRATVGRAIERSAARLGLRDLVSVRQVTVADGTSPVTRSRAAERAGERVAGGRGAEGRGAGRRVAEGRGAEDGPAR